MNAVLNSLERKKEALKSEKLTPEVLLNEIDEIHTNCP
ncbi:hypothetical protein HLPCO_000958 [Haloplasma contractile SSD-17B]|uniref:Uncharacterized protein n=1 Tax=Haloplasma contractile SSD-17B TaxID=1033810 RepID=U2FQM2_9MOLU|nr:hypothetical protein HLPCO_000958 [Haloplasma contractile SSD-17B]